MKALGLGTAKEEESEWLSVSDLMAGLMVIFLFIAIVFIRPLAEENKALEAETVELERQRAILSEERRDLIAQRERVERIVLAWQNTEDRIYEALRIEFEDDLPRWKAELDRETLRFRFKAPDVLFQRGKARLRPEFAAILADFFPRYVGVLRQFRGSIEEVRIEGHTSSVWGRSIGAEEAYILNMELSQARTRAVLAHSLDLDAVDADRDWLRPLLTANGLSSSRPILDADGAENREASRRVEFRVRTRARAEIVRVLGEIR